jgi:hypothetical protein
MESYLKTAAIALIAVAIVSRIPAAANIVFGPSN